MNKESAKKAGLIPVGRNEDGEMDYLGTDEQFNLAEDLEEKKEQEEENDIEGFDDGDNTNFSNISPEAGM